MKVEPVTREDLGKFEKELSEEIRKHHPHPRRQVHEPRAWLKSFEVRKLLGISAGTLQNIGVNDIDVHENWWTDVLRITD